MFRLRPRRAGVARSRKARAAPPNACVEIVPMRRSHLKSVIAIERRIFPSPWSIGLYLSEITQPATRAYYVACVGPEVVGYAGMMVVVGEAHVTNIGVAPEWQRHGVARRLLLQLAARGPAAIGPAPDPRGAGVERGRAGPLPRVRFRTGRRAQELLLRGARGRARHVGPRHPHRRLPSAPGGDRGSAPAPRPASWRRPGAARAQ